MTVTQVDGQALRTVMAAYLTGVTVVTGMVDGTPVGMAVNSFTSVSLDPPLVAFCPARTSTTWQAMRAAATFAVNILADGQQALCRQMAQRGIDRFAGVEWSAGPDEVPLLDGALAWLACRPTHVHPAGDHHIVVAQVIALDQRPGAPLVFHRGALTGLADR